MTNNDVTPASTSPSAPSLEPNVYIINNFVIEAYSTISDVPFTSVTEQRGRIPKTSDNERFDELYGRCRICMGHKSGEHLILCDDCDRGFHMTCLVPALRDVPKGEWTCAKCTQERKYNLHARATAVVNLNNVIRDIQTRPSLPLKMQLKMLNVSAPHVQYAHVAGQIDENNPLLDPTLDDLPPKFRIKRPALPTHPFDEQSKSQPVVMCKKISTDSMSKRYRTLSTLSDQLTPFSSVIEYKALQKLQKKLASRKAAVERREKERAMYANDHTQNYVDSHENGIASRLRTRKKWRPLKPRGASCNRCRHMRCVCVGNSSSPVPTLHLYPPQQLSRKRSRPDTSDRVHVEVKQRRT